MTQCFEFEGKNVKKAIHRASETLNIPKEKLDHEVISYGSTGIFGLVGTKKAKIRVTLPASDNYKSPVEAALEEIENQPTESEAPDDCQLVPDDVEAPVVEEIDADALQKGLDALKTLVDFITDGTEIHMEQRGSRILYRVEGGNAGILIGKRGKTLEALQYMIEKIVNKNSDKRIYVRVDIGGYLEKRKQNLTRLAFRMADKAQQTGKPTTLNQMNAQDRRIIHLALKDRSGVRTQSVGEGHVRKLVIIPKRGAARRNSKDRSNFKKKDGTD